MLCPSVLILLPIALELSIAPARSFLDAPEVQVSLQGLPDQGLSDGDRPDSVHGVRAFLGMEQSPPEFTLDILALNSPAGGLDRKDLFAEVIPETPAETIPTETIPETPAEESTPSKAPLPTPSESPVPPLENQTIQDDQGNTTDSDALFERVFGRPRQLQPQQVVVPYLINGQPQGEVLVNLELGTQTIVRWPASEFLSKLAQLVRPDLLSNLTAAVDPNGFLTLETLQNNGLDATFDSQKLELIIQIPPEQRNTNILDRRISGAPPELASALHPNAFSGYVNLRGGVNWIWEDPQADQLGRQPLNLQIDGAVNLLNWVLEGRAAFQEQTEPAWVRGDLRLVHDLPNLTLRIIAGDLSVPIRGYQTALPMGGITVARNFGLQPYVVTRPINTFEFFLENPSRVEIFINGRLDRILNLPAGPQDIRDLALGSGANAVELVITDAVGQVQRLNFSTALAAGLLAPGTQQFAYSLGAPSQVEGGQRSYDTSQLMVTASHRLGLTKSLTGGPYLQANTDQQLLGLEGIWATPWGNWGIDLATSHAKTVGTDFGGILRYDRFQSGPNNPSNRSVSLELEYIGTNFAQIAPFPFQTFDLDPVNDIAYSATLNYSQKLFAQIQGNFNARYNWGRSPRSDDYNLSLGLSRRLRRGLNLSVRFSHIQPATGPTEQQIFSTLSLSLPQQRQNFSLSTDISNQSRSTQRFNWSNNSARAIGGVNLQANLEQTPTRYDSSFNLERRGFLGEFDLTQDLTFPSTSRTQYQQSSRLNFGTGLVFAGGRLAITRPVNDSFVMISRHPALRGYAVEINSSPLSGPAALAHRLGPGVLANLQPYQLNPVRISAPTLPIGYSLGDQLYNVVPTYKSGRLIQVGTGATVFGRGILLNAQGEPIALQGGQVILQSEEGSQPIPFFTNRVGRFALEGLQPGRYELILLNPQRSSLIFEVPQGSEGLLDLGELSLD